MKGTLMENELEEAKKRIDALEKDLLNLYRLNSISSKGRELDLQEIIELRKENHELRAKLSKIQDNPS
jgi:predicted RNase H-like nuclease (RuvC/YqgF family)